MPGKDVDLVDLADEAGRRFSVTLDAGDCHRLVIESEDPIDSRIFRSIEIGRILHEARRITWANNPKSRPPLSDQSGDWTYEDVAVIYMTAYLSGAHPTQAVASAYGISKNAAAQRVAKARKRGMIGSTEPGKPGI